jgi:hypothetical protein
MTDHRPVTEGSSVESAPSLYTIRLDGHLGPTALSAFPKMVAQETGPDTVLTGLVEDRSALFGLIGQIEALGLELAELRRLGPRRQSPVSGDGASPDAS